jgi:hypothetical protein
MNWGFAGGYVERLDDGLGTRRLEVVHGKAVEVLDVAPSLAQHPTFEAEIRAKAARLGDLTVEGLAPVHRIDREGARLSVISEHVYGIRLCDLLRAAQVPAPAAVALAGRVIHAVAGVHLKPGLVHGAITPAHIVIDADGNASLTDGIFGGALESLQRNREQLWREFRVAMPSSANLPRFDVRADVAQLGATVLSIFLGRLMNDDEYPRPVTDVINAATRDAAVGDPGSTASRARMWLHQALQLHPRENFANAGDAERGFGAVVGTPGSRRAATAALQTVLRGVMGTAGASQAEPAPVIRSFALGSSIAVSRP